MAFSSQNTLISLKCLNPYLIIYHLRVSLIMKIPLLILSLVMVNTCFANTTDLKTRFSTINIQQEVNDKFSLSHQNKAILAIEGKSFKQEAIFRFDHKEIILLRFLQGYNSRTDKLVFVGVNKNGSVNISPVFEHPANVPIDVKQKDDTAVADLGIERSMHNYLSYDGTAMKRFQKGAKAIERKAEPIPDGDCNKIYNNLYIPSFNKSYCGGIAHQINSAFENTVEYKAMSVRSDVLDETALVDMATDACKSKTVVIYNDFKTKVCGYSLIVPNSNKLKNYAKDN